ncbi:hypothetical protein GPJ56_008001 [Histomonas meleagridis]|uniref:uncharacterized protein n=1 Tax=Histomonas meleagridis TaxID=135588 RepID=UPI003559DD8F|nr:hypothetical protein GPJ56_008001 [Histomonas meleagridis]KAH0803943.1 hypothetical protein GO595_002773 [Histomonas meleagridis]
MDLSKELLTIFKPAEVYKSFTTSVNGALVDLLSCGYRMRYGDGERGIGKAQSFSIEIQHHIIRMWLKSLIRASESTDSKTNDLFYSRLSGSILDTISLLSNRISLSCDDLFTGNENDSNLNTLISSSKKVIEELDKMDEEDFEADSPYNTEYLGLLMDIIVVGISGIVVGMYQIDIDDLAEKVVNFVKALVTNSKETSALKISMEKSCKSYLTEMLRYLDGHRFESDFQFVYCTWDVMKSE